RRSTREFQGSEPGQSPAGAIRRSTSHSGPGNHRRRGGKVRGNAADVGLERVGGGRRGDGRWRDGRSLDYGRSRRRDELRRGGSREDVLLDPGDLVGGNAHLAATVHLED